MMKRCDETKNAAPAKDAAPLCEQHGNNTKQARILAVLRSGTSLNRFEAERLGDHCLNSTIAKLRAEGHSIIGTWQKVPNRFGSMTRVKRYRYAGENHV